jgi:hypothetical protein
MIPDFDIKQLNNIYIGDIDPNDYPDFCDAYIESADYGDRELTDEECEWITDTYPEIVQEKAFDQLL